MIVQVYGDRTLVLNPDVQTKSYGLVKDFVGLKGGALLSKLDF